MTNGSPANVSQADHRRPTNPMRGNCNWFVAAHACMPTGHAPIKVGKLNRMIIIVRLRLTPNTRQILP